jgi:Protein kinase domain/AAA ATPase domain
VAEPARTGNLTSTASRATLPAAPRGVDAVRVAGERFRVKRHLGAGASKEVYQAEDLTLKRDVALALIPGVGMRGSTRERVLHEVQTTARLEHPHIVTVYDVREAADATIIVSRLIRGGSAADWLGRTEPGAARVQSAVKIARQVASALAHAHAEGVIHRDVKPSNILLTSDGTALLADFGVALLAEAAADGGGVVGSLPYMPPEQAAGAPVDARSDLYALGVTVYQLACGELPFEDRDAALIRARRGPPPDLRRSEPAVPRALSDLIVRLLAPALEERPASAAEVERALASIAAAPVAARRAAPFPAALQTAADRPFVGREAALEALRAAWRGTDGTAGLALVSGEAGIGKTTLAANFARERNREGAVVLYGRCDEEPLISYQPFVEALIELLAQQPDLARSLDARLEPELTELGKLVPALRRTTVLPGGEAQRYLLFEAVVALLGASAAERPLLLVLDDLQWAPRPTMLLLRHVLRAAAPGRVLVLGTVRTNDRAGEDPLSGIRGELRRGRGHFESVALAGLAATETGALISARAGRDADGRFIQALHDTTSGNPFFIEETLRHLRDQDLSTRSLFSLGVPEGAKEVIERRLEQLQQDARDLLKTAAVCGRTFRLDVLTELLDAPAARLVGPLEEAMSAGLVVEPEIGRFTYCHALVRETLYSAIASGTSRARAHLAVGEALEALDGDDAPASELALHFHASRHVGGAEKAVAHGRKAAAVAADALAYEEAARHERQVLDALEILGRDAERFQVLDRLGRLQWQSGDSVAAKATFREKAALARRLDDAGELARAALGFGGRWYDAENIDEELISLLREARELLPRRDGPTQAKVIARLAQAVRPADREGEARTLNREALAMARRIGDPDALIDAVSGEHTALQHVDDLEGRLELGAEWVKLAREEEHEDALALALCWRAFDLFEHGDVEASRAARQQLTELAERLRQPLYRTFATSWEFKWLGAEGRFEEAGRKARECHRYARQAHASYANSQFAGQVFSLLRDAGAVAQAPGLVEQHMAGEATLSAWRAGLVLAHAAGGETERARSELAELVADGFGAIARDVFWLPALCILAEAAAALGDRDAGEALAAALAPYADRNAQIGFAVLLGPVQLFAAMAAAAAGRTDEAERRFGESIDRSAALGMLTAEVYARCGYGEVLLARGGRRARTELEHALDIARRLGMAGCAARAERGLGHEG